MNDRHSRITIVTGQCNGIRDQDKLYTSLDLVTGYLARTILAWPPSNLRCVLGAIFARVPIFLIGGAGVGKTLLMKTIAALAGEGTAYHYDLSTCDIFHLVGLPDVSSYRADGNQDLAFRTHSRSLLRNPGYILWDEISRSTCENQALLMEAIESSSVLGFKITSRHILASNPTGNGFKSVHGVDAALADRALVTLNVDQGAWVSNPERAGRYVVQALDGLEFGSAPTDEERAAFAFLSNAVPTAASSLLQSFLRDDDRRAGLATFTKELAMHASSLGKVISNRVLVRTARFLPYLILLNKGDTESAVRDCVTACFQHRCELQEEAVSLCARHAYEGLMMPDNPERELISCLARDGIEISLKIEAMREAPANLDPSACLSTHIKGLLPALDSNAAHLESALGVLQVWNARNPRWGETFQIFRDALVSRRARLLAEEANAALPSERDETDLDVPSFLRWNRHQAGNVGVPVFGDRVNRVPGAGIWADLEARHAKVLQSIPETEDVNDDVPF
ncbi:MAG: hypothetical protein AAB229_07340 [Candidatus Hydrogenedentota bacterium]|mgnify:CR=1 FL=1